MIKLIIFWGIIGFAVVYLAWIIRQMIINIRFAKGKRSTIIRHRATIKRLREELQSDPGNRDKINQMVQRQRILKDFGVGEE